MSMRWNALTIAVFSSNWRWISPALSSSFSSTTVLSDGSSDGLLARADGDDRFRGTPPVRWLAWVAAMATPDLSEDLLERLDVERDGSPAC